MNKTSFVRTKENCCMGCNKCIFVCPTKANEAFFEEEEGKVLINPGLCISCGECIDICDHNARDFFDDTQRFFNDIDKDENISVIIAPSAKFNFPSVTKLIGYLKYIGVKHVYDVSFGADICTWAHVKMIREKKLGNIIAQPCPVIVSYIEKYHPELLSQLSPVQSPMMCLSIYLQKYLGIKDKIMFLSPCIGKKSECMNEETQNNVEYSITFTKFTEYLKENDIDLENFDDANFDKTDGSIGFTFSRPGGLSENIKFNIENNVWIKQIEGIRNIEKYFKEYISDSIENKPLPRIVDALNCEHGCNLGTGTLKHARLNDIDYALNLEKELISKENAERLMDFFNENLTLSDFHREYKDKSIELDSNKVVDIEAAFIALGKITENDRNVNCFSCGYGNCYDFAHDLALGKNSRNNCKYFLLNKFKKLSLFDDLTGICNRYSYSVTIEDFRKVYPGSIGIAYVDINGLKQANDTYGHSYGDTMIIKCANVLKKVFENSIYRIGGDEFIVLNSGIDKEPFLNKIQTLRNLYKEEENLMVSIGVAFSNSPEDIDEMLDLADHEMYVEKQAYYNTRKNVERRNRRH